MWVSIRNHIESSLIKETQHWAPLRGSARTCGAQRELLPWAKVQPCTGNLKIVSNFGVLQRTVVGA